MLKAQIILSIALILIALPFGIKAEEPSCLGIKGENVDWFVIFLFPETSSNSILTYGYVDNTSQKLNYYLYENETFPPIRVIAEAEVKGSQSGPEKTNFFFWNDNASQEGDEEPSSAGSGKAHSKGGLLYNKTKGFLISHSLPGFPTRSSNNMLQNYLPSNSGKFGQTFFCITLNKENSIKVIETLNIILPGINLTHGTTDLVDGNNPQVEKLIKNKFDSKLPNEKITQITSIGGSHFHIFSKGRENIFLPYDKAIPEFYKSGFYVETWTRPEQMPNICAQPSVQNVNKVKFDGYKFSKNQEHSKWAVGKEKDIACFGDLNRASSQKKRGGNVICFENKNLANIMRKAIDEFESCPKGFLEYLD